MIQLPPSFNRILVAALDALPSVLLVLAGAVVLRLVIGRGLALLADRTKLTPQDLRPLKRVLVAVLYVTALILVCGVFGVNLGGLWALLSTILAMVAIGFVAVWSLLSNVSSTVIILLFHPFAIGDEIELIGDPVSGRVVDLNFLYTTLRTADGALIQVPNNLFFQKSLRRRCNTPHPVSLAQQLNSTQAAEV